MEKLTNLKIDAVVIGRNEGERLVGCLGSLQNGVRRLVYVDSGSSDGSVETARRLGAEVVQIDMSHPFTAARARNAGLAVLQAPDLVQFVDGDCEVDAGWITAAVAGFVAHPAAVVICGRRRERFPKASIYNALADSEWNTPIGQAKACGGDALMRYDAIQAVGGYRADLIAGEEPELCLRLAREGGEIWRIDAEMTLHDAALHRFSQWWRRTVRAGYAFAEGAALYGRAPERHWTKEARRSLIWGLVLPLAIVIAGLLHPLGWLLALIYPVQLVRLSRRMGVTAAFFALLGKFAEAWGALHYWLGRLRRQRRGLIEYK